MADFSILSRQSKDDIKITFEKDGEAVTVFVNQSDLTPPAGGKFVADKLVCVLCCTKRSGFGACVARCLADGQCCDSGISNCVSV